MSQGLEQAYTTFCTALVFTGIYMMTFEARSSEDDVKYFNWTIWLLVAAQVMLGIALLLGF
jgi:hypothetical protein